MFKKILPIVALLAFAVQASLITAHITADDAFALYSGNANATDLAFIGRNTTEWTTTSTFTFSQVEGEYLYLAAWSDNSGDQGILGEFDIRGGATILTGAAWESHLTFKDINATFRVLPTVWDVTSEIRANTWTGVTHTIDNGADPWGLRPGISADADWMWGSAMTPGSGYGEYQLFRIQIDESRSTDPDGESRAAIPEPGSLALLGLGLVGMTALFRSRNRA